MNNNQQENEVKFMLSDLTKFETKLIQLSATLKKPRVHEINLRFDTPDGTLTRERRVLRLRQDSRARLTYKGPADLTAAIASRPEIEFEVSSFEDAKAFLHALGYQISVAYEKYRTIYLFNDVEVDLDEMPYGTFCEIEGKDELAIASASRTLDLKWENRCLDSYIMLFNRLKSNNHLDFNDLTFENFKGLSFSPSDLGLLPAD
jgi:adenylate cyclase class 2